MYYHFWIFDSVSWPTDCQFNPSLYCGVENLDSYRKRCTTTHCIFELVKVYWILAIVGWSPIFHICALKLYLAFITSLSQMVCFRSPSSILDWTGWIFSSCLFFMEGFIGIAHIWLLIIALILYKMKLLCVVYIRSGKGHRHAVQLLSFFLMLDFF